MLRNCFGGGSLATSFPVREARVESFCDFPGLPFVHCAGMLLPEHDVEAVDDSTDPGEEPKEQVDPEVFGRAHFECDGDGWDEDRENDHHEGVVFEIGHWLRLRLGVKFVWV